MYFRPKIFISSLLQEKIELRKKVKTVLESSGAEILLYEKNLTPSVDKMTYRKDILEADFVIFILDDKQGTPTDTGLSGTEEEFLITERKLKPSHVYVMESSSSEFISSLGLKGYSYYIYKNFDDLISRIKSSVFTIAKEISMFDMSSESLAYNTVKKIAFNKDYEFALEFVRRNNIFKLHFNNQSSSRVAVGFFYLFDSMYEWFIENEQDIFIDTKITSLLGQCLKKQHEFAQKRSKEFTRNTGNEQKIKIDDDLTITVPYSDSPNNPKIVIDYKWYEQKLVEYYKMYKEFYDYISFRKIMFDSKSTYNSF